MWSIEKDLIGGKDMFQFETQLKKLKHEVLTEVAKLAKEDSVTLDNIEKIPYEVIKGNKPTYRCNNN